MRNSAILREWWGIESTFSSNFMFNKYEETEKQRD